MTGPQKWILAQNEDETKNQNYPKTKINPKIKKIRNEDEAKNKDDQTKTTTRMTVKKLRHSETWGQQKRKMTWKMIITMKLTGPRKQNKTTLQFSISPG